MSVYHAVFVGCNKLEVKVWLTASTEDGLMMLMKERYGPGLDAHLVAEEDGLPCAPPGHGSKLLWAYRAKCADDASEQAFVDKWDEDYDGATDSSRYTCCCKFICLVKSPHGLSQAKLCRSMHVF